MASQKYVEVNRKDMRVCGVIEVTMMDMSLKDTNESSRSHIPRIKANIKKNKTIILNS